VCMYSVLFRAAEGAGAGAVLMLLAGLMQRRLRWSDFVYSLVQTATTSAMIFAVLLGAEVFNAFLALTQMPEEAAELIGGLSISPYPCMAALMALYLALG